MQNEWILRTYFHWKEFTEKKNGLVFFITLTYNDNAIPYIIQTECLSEYGSPTLVSELVRGVPNKYIQENAKFCFKCFNKRDIDRFFNSVRQHFLRNYEITGIDYLVCSEYGSQNSCRSHYHVLVFIPNVWLMYPALRGESDIIRRCKEVFTHYWENVQKNGFVIYSTVEKGGAVVKSPVAIKYVGKYVTKDLDFWENQQVKDFFFDVENRELFKHSLPRHFQSKGFGRFLCDYIVDSDSCADLLLDGFKMSVSGKDKKPYFYPIPAYNRRKLMYDVIYQQHDEKRVKQKIIMPKRSQIIKVNKRTGKIKVCTKVRHFNVKYDVKTYQVTDHTFVVPNNNYYRFNVLTLPKRLDSTMAKLELDLSSIGLQKYFQNRFYFCEFVKKYTEYDGILDFSHFSQWLKSLLGEFRVLDLAIYKLVYRGVCNSTLLKGDLLANYENNYFTLLKHKVECKYWDSAEHSPKIDKNRLICNVDSLFANFEKILYILDKMKQNLSARTANAGYQRYLQMKKTKSYFEKI